MVTIDYFFSNKDDYEDYPRFQETDRVVISAKVHRRMPAQSEFDDRYLPLFIFERQAWRSSKRGWVNVNKKYHAYLADDGEIKHITFKTWKTFIKALNTELDKTRVENEITEEIVNFSPYENIPSVTLHHTFFSDEALLIEDTIEKIVEEEWSTTEIREKIINMDNLIWKTLLDIEDAKREIEKIKKYPKLVVVPDAVNSLTEIESDIKEMHNKLYREHGNLKLIRHDYYAILEERRKLSANLHDTIHTILYATSPKYRELCAQKKSLEELISAAVKNGDEKLVAEIIKREERLKELENKLQALTKQHEELTRRGTSSVKRLKKELERR